MKTLKVLTAVTLFALSALTHAAVVESFTDGQLSAPGWSTGIGADAGSYLASAPDGSNGLYLDDATWSYNTSIDFHAGQTLSAWINPGPSSSNVTGAQGGRLYLGFQSGTSATYSITAASDSNQLLFQSSSSDTMFANGQSVDQSWNDQWYRLALTWSSGGAFTASLYDSDGATLLNQMSTVLADTGATGIALRGLGGAAIASIDVSPVPEPSETALLASGLGLLALVSRRRRIAA